MALPQTEPFPVYRHISCDLSLEAARRATTVVLAFASRRSKCRSIRNVAITLPEPGVTLNRYLGRASLRHVYDGKVRIVGTARKSRCTGELPARKTAGGATSSAGPGCQRRPGMDGHPTLDSLPVLGRSARHPNVYFAFGHNHSGLTLGGMTGRLMADLVAGRTSFWRRSIRRFQV